MAILFPARRRGQVQPYNSLPRINWRHPLARGLVSYGYDRGNGPVDLVSGRSRTVNSTAEITSQRSASKFGVSTLYANGNNPTQPCQYTLPSNVPFASITNGGIYSFATGCIQTAAPATSLCQLYGSGDSTANTPFLIATSSTNTKFLVEF